MDQPQDGTLTTAPPPPTEVKIRTMKSDIAMMAASGGGLPRFENVHVAGLSAQHESKEQAATSAVRAGSKNNLLLIVILIVVLAAVAIVGWFVYGRLSH